MIELKDIEKKIKGYGFDSLVFRYKMAREAQARFEEKEYRRKDEITRAEHSHSMTEKDIMRFIQILDDLIGEHD